MNVIHAGSHLQPLLLFCTVTLFAAGCDRSFEGTAPVMYASLAEQVATKPFLRCEETALVAALQRQGKWRGDKPAVVFAALRARKAWF